ncbi:alkaline phosphatase family protein [Aspergillus fischeri NRRL 181]|uniref:Type I phosphodiesterase / nucleotide pyrophosphatase family protein n=1 Tax=Neosartorya fischeri (strain ATCC 1020 / DSM 3700 / CBS 544.65 / FGSC A1164 / JCM 1740 / NRRL 181 / WB 181) TaxID=331117 RepID=A1DI35_NEOFI|nr:Type I phosphodiesterase / nucleotide pyrophosphatase family protein [Aspergillus fischeri NRRL 181]EAW19042.1 Type I phosphodiesterase / nucleotide pyrophosphatase family protein [Aspergillus fischeri NRRL 181]
MPPRPDLLSPSLLSPGDYDDDASSLRSLSEQDSDPDDDEFLRKTRTTLELAEHDRAVLEEEEEMEKLLVRSGPTHGLRRIFSPNGSSVKIGKYERNRDRRRKRHDERKRRRRSAAGENGELMYEMEEGYRESESSLLSGSSSELDQRLEKQYADIRPRRISRTKLVLVFAAVLVLFLIFLLGAYKASSGFRASHSSQHLLSNGSALFGPTTILVSLDGFRADFLDRGLTPTLNALIAEGVSPQYMLPSFPSVTFPNHFTLVTGLYPESHGIVSNTFWDPALKENFHYTNQSISMQPKWWNAEPLWMTAEKHGLKTGIHMWPGSEAHIGGVDPAYLDKYNGSEELPRKVDRILELLDLPGGEEESLIVPERPQFIAAYVPNVDADGHKFGPNSTEIRSTISQVDSMLAELMSGLRSRNLTDIVNLVIVSDHGMATTATERLIQLDDFIELGLVDRIDGWPLRGIRPRKPEDLEILQKQLENLTLQYPHAVEVYTRETMPERYHFSHNDRIAPLWVIPKTGWAIVERPDFDAQEAIRTGRVYHPKGVHGYDHEHPLMRAIFIARGPAFPHPPNSRLEVFQNINVYNLVCDSLGIDPLPNNGTMRLPLQPVGLHSDEDAPIVDKPADPPISSASVSVVPSQTMTPASTPSEVSSTALIQPTSPSENEPSSEPQNEPESDDEQGPTWWGTLWSKVEELKEWATDIIETVKDNIA